MNKEKFGFIALGFMAGLILTHYFAFFHHRESHEKKFFIHKMDHRMMMNSDMNMSHTMDSMTDALKGKTGDEFDKEFLAQMIIHHEGAVDMANQVIATSKRPELIKLANEIISAQTAEINKMKEWQKSWFNQ